MHIAILSGAYGNVGDSLIEHRCQKIFENIYGENSTKVFSRKEIGNYIDEINEYDMVAFSGGPIYQKNISRNFKIEEALKIKKPLVVVGGGWRGAGRCLTSPYKYEFMSETKSLLERIDNFNGLGCRDLYTVKALKAEGLSSALMTGCPAWYDIALVDRVQLIDNHWELKKIYISDPANSQNYYLLKPLIEKLHKLFSEAEITLVFHRAICSDTEIKLEKSLSNYDYVKFKRLNADAESFSLYNACDLHIGFRVHAHIYNLSQRKKTILIEEDGRGAGVNEALGLPGLLAYNDENQIVYGNRNSFGGRVVRRIAKKIRKNKNDYIQEQVERYIDMMVQTNGVYYQNAFILMKEYYKTMEKYVSDIIINTNV